MTDIRTDNEELAEPDGGNRNAVILACLKMNTDQLSQDAATLIGQLHKEVERLTGALTDARSAIASLPRFALGGVALTDTHTGECTGQYGVRDELLSKIDDALTGEHNG